MSTADKEDVIAEDESTRTMDVGYLFPWLNRPGWRQSLKEAVNRTLGVSQTYAMFEKAVDAVKKSPDEVDERKNIFLSMLEENEMTMDFGDLIKRLPADGPVIVVANHPFGGADAMALTGLCARVRPDTKVLANAVTAGLPGTSDWTIPLQILGEDGATQSNRAAMKEALTLLRGGGVLVVFPAGAVSRWQWNPGAVVDPEWSEHVARLSTKTGVPVLPVRFFGRNPVWFEVLGWIHPVLRSVLIVRVFLAARGQRVKFRAGDMIEAESLKKHGSAAEMTSHLRRSVEEIPDL